MEERKMTIGVRDVDKDTWIEFRAWCAEHNLKVGEAVTHAMKATLDKEAARAAQTTI